MEHVGVSLAAFLEDIVKQSKSEGARQAVEALSASMEKAVVDFLPAAPAETDVFCIFDVADSTKQLLESAAENGKFSERVVALILQNLQK